MGYIAGNSVHIKTRDIDKLTSLLDALTTAGADTIYGPRFAISDPGPLRKEARIRRLRGKPKPRNMPATTVTPRSAAFSRRRRILSWH